MGCIVYYCVLYMNEYNEIKKYFFLRKKPVVTIHFVSCNQSNHIKVFCFLSFVLLLRITSKIITKIIRKPQNFTTNNIRKIMTIESNINFTSEITDDIIRRQLDRKRVLDHELQRDKQRLEIMQYDITILERSFTVSDLDRLIEEIQFLRSECNKMSEILDKAGVHALGDTTTNISNSISGINGEFFYNLKLFLKLIDFFLL